MKVYTNRNNIVVSKSTVKAVAIAAVAVATIVTVVYITTDVIDVEMHSNVTFERQTKTIEVPYYSMSRIEQLDSEK